MTSDVEAPSRGDPDEVENDSDIPGDLKAGPEIASILSDTATSLNNVTGVFDTATSLVSRTGNQNNKRITICEIVVVALVVLVIIFAVVVVGGNSPNPAQAESPIL